MFDDGGGQQVGGERGPVATIRDSVRFDRIPDGLSEMPPGARLGTVLASIDRRRLNGKDQVLVMQAWNRQVAHAQAELYASMMTVAEAEAELYPEDDPYDVNQVTASEIRAALTLTRRSADYHLGFAQQLVTSYPELWTALHRGHVDLPKTRVIITQTSHLDRENADQVTRVALERAQHQTTGQLRARLHKLVIDVDPESARARYEETVSGRRVTAEPTESGTANVFGLDLPPADTNSAMRRINRLARTIKTKNDPRTMDQIRADIFLDLLNGRQEQTGSAPRGVVDIRVDLTTLLDLEDKAGEIPCWGPVIADIARQVVSEQDHTEWRYTVTDTETGQVIHDGTTRRRPTTTQRRRVQALSPTCVFYTCRISSRDCDIDHRQAWADGGHTEDPNLAPLCRHDHTLKHHGWTVRMILPGIYVWTSPLGLEYTVEAQPP